MKILIHQDIAWKAMAHDMIKNEGVGLQIGEIIGWVGG